MSKENLLKWHIAGLQAYKSAVEQSKEGAQKAESGFADAALKQVAGEVVSMMEQHKNQLIAFLEDAGAEVDAVHDEIADGINRGSELSEKAAGDENTLDVALLFRSIVSMNYFVTAFSNHAISAKTLVQEDQSAAFERMAAEQQQYIDQYVSLSKFVVFPKFA